MEAELLNLDSKTREIYDKGELEGISHALELHKQTADLMQEIESVTVMQQEELKNKINS